MSDLGRIKFFLTPSHECSYLPDKRASTLFADPNLIVDQEAYSALSQMGFRRSGNHIYRPHCERCNACIPMRVLTNEFIRRGRHKRIWKRNAHLMTHLTPAVYSEEHYNLYQRYIEQRHKDGDMYPPSIEQYQSFLLCDWARSFFIELRHPDTHQLLAVAVTDTLAQGLSAIYTFYDPDYDKLSLGTYAILKQIETTAERNLNHLYIGYWIKECNKMSYKNEFKPAEMFINQHWERIGAPACPQ